MGRIIFYVLIIVGLCFGQGIWLKENPKITLPIPINVAIRSEEGINEIAMRKFSLYSLQTLSLISPLYPNTLIMQVEGETLQPKTSFWKQAGIYGLEFIGGTAGTALSALCAVFIACPSVDLEDYNLLRGLSSYFVGNMLITSTCVWGTGSLLRQHNSWLKTSVGAGLGTFLGISIAYLLTHQFTESNDAGASFLLACPPIGAVVAFNIK